MTVAALEMRTMPDEALLSLYRSDERAAAAALAEAAWRDRTDRAAASRAAIRAEWYDAAYAQYLQAEAVTRGNLLSRAGLAAGIADPISLWHGARAAAERYASPELLEFWDASPRVTVSEYTRQLAVANRAAREETPTSLPMRGAPMSSTTWTPTGGQDWRLMTPAQFDRATAPEQTSLFGPTVELVKPAPGPQMDLFSGEAE